MESQYNFGSVGEWDGWEDAVWPFQLEGNTVDIGYTEYRMNGNQYG